MKRLLLIFGILLLITQCESDNNDDIDVVDPTDDITDDQVADVVFSRADLLTNWADNIIIPSYQNLQASLNEVETVFNTFSTDVSEGNLIALREAWLAAYFVWQNASPFETGPAEARGFRLNINSYPTDVPDIEEAVTFEGTADEVDLVSFSNRTIKGFPSLDYLLNGSAASDAAIVARFTDTNEGANLISYTGRVLGDMQRLTNEVLGEWTDSFRDAFIDNDGSSATASTDIYVNDYIFHYEFFIRSGKVGIPAGLFSDGEVLPQNIEARFIGGNVSNQLCIAAIDAVQDFFNGVGTNSGVDGIGLDDYLEAVDPRVDNQGTGLAISVNDQYDEARTTIQNLQDFEIELQDDLPLPMIRAFDELQGIVPLIKSTMLSFLNIALDFQDGDGD